jgi:CubicO group peptidase (beta-lactamase class C family)
MAQQAGLDPGIVDDLGLFLDAHRDPSKTCDQRWALWQHGYLVHCQGDLDATMDVASLRKTWHAMIVGAEIQQGRIPSLNQRIAVWLPELRGPHAEATWWHVLTQSAGFDYPHGEHSAYFPGEMWTYSDWNLYHLCHALARVYGKQGLYDHYADVAEEAYFGAIGMRRWGTRIVYDRASQMDDGVRFLLSLEHLGRLGLLALARGVWAGEHLVPRWYVEALETKQTYGMQVNYQGPDDGQIGLDPVEFPEAPYGLLTWVNTDGDFFRGAGQAWAMGSGAGGTKVLWNHYNGVVFAGIGIAMGPGRHSVPHIVEAATAGPNPLL